MHMRKTPGAPGENWSYALGGPMPESRAQRKAIEKQKGIEFIPPSEMPTTWKNALDYRRHVDAGGERLPPEAFSDRPPPSTLRERIKDWYENHDGYAKSNSDYGKDFKVDTAKGDAL